MFDENEKESIANLVKIQLRSTDIYVSVDLLKNYSTGSYLKYSHCKTSSSLVTIRDRYSQVMNVVFPQVDIQSSIV